MCLFTQSSDIDGVLARCLFLGSSTFCFASMNTQSNREQGQLQDPVLWNQWHVLGVVKVWRSLGKMDHSAQTIMSLHIDGVRRS